MPENLHIGTSGWMYKHWAKERFYPKGLKQADWLPFFAQHFSSVELNVTFYRFPTESMVNRWREITDPPFVFAAKMWQYITHIKRLLNCERELREFLEMMEKLGGRKGPLLVQLPPSMKRNLERLDDFLAQLSQLAVSPWQVAVEFRNSEWLCAQTNTVLDRHGATMCLADYREMPIETPNPDASFIYLRRHGSHRGEGGNYTSEEIADDAAKVRSWLAEKREVFVFYNNDWHGYAIDNALELAQQLGVENPMVPLTLFEHPLQSK